MTHINGFQPYMLFSDEEYLSYNIYTDKEQYELSLTVNEIKRVTYSPTPNIICFEIDVKLSTPCFGENNSYIRVLHLSHDQIYGNFQFVDSLKSLIISVCNQYMVKDFGTLINISAKYDQDQIRAAIQRIINTRNIIDETRIPGFSQKDNWCYYTIPLNRYATFRMSLDLSEFQKVILAKSNYIPQYSISDTAVIRHFLQITNEDKRRFLFLYYHLCYMASLFEPLNHDIALVVDTNASITTYLTRFLFSDADDLGCERSIPDETENSTATAFFNTKDLPFIFEVNDDANMKKCKNTLSKISKWNGVMHNNYQTHMQAIPIVFSSQPECCEEYLHLCIEREDLSIPLMPMQRDFNYVSYFTMIRDRLNGVEDIDTFKNGLVDRYPVTILKKFNDLYFINKQESDINGEPAIYAVLRTLDHFLKWHYSSRKDPMVEKYLSISRIFEEDIDEYLARYIPTLKLNSSFDKESFYSTIKTLVDDQSVLIFNRDKRDFTKCPTQDILDEEACLLYSDASWALNEAALTLIAQSMQNPCSFTRLLKLLKKERLLTGRKINDDSYQTRLRVYFNNGEHEDVGLYEIPPEEGILHEDMDDYLFDSVGDGLHFHLGKNAASGADMYWDFDSESNINQHMLITGGSGAGKSCFLDDLVSQAKNQKITTVVFHQQGTVPCSDRESVLDIIQDKLGLVCFDEDSADHHKVAERLASALHLTINQKERISEAYESYLDQKTGCNEDSELPAGDPSVHDFIEILLKKKKLFKEVPPTIRQKLSNFEGMNAASAKIINWADYEGKRVILDFRKAPNEDWYKYNAELYLQDLFRYRQSCFPENGEPAPMIIISDEFQNMNTKKGAALEKILREGRKYGIALWLASQLVESDTGSKLKGITDQCSMKVYFMAGTERAKKIARMLSLSTSEKTKMLAQICSLKKREFVFQLNGNKPYKCIANEVKKRSNGE